MIDDLPDCYLLMNSRYLNTDLDIESVEDLSPLIKILKRKCDLLHGGKDDAGLWRVTIEARNSGFVGGEGHDQVADINEILKVIESLSDEIQKLLLGAQKFEFNIGWQSSEKRPVGAFSLPTELLGRVAGIGATIAVTIYPSNENDFEEEASNMTT